jgi:hypothetical protein
MGYYNDKQNSGNPMLDEYVTACYTLAKCNHLLSNEDEEVIMKIAKKVLTQSKYQY